ncbi:hypothetical protein A0H81_07206 [Grifola frondosa]|uniref:Uncharacterized protein n=1 Tax=Grifola frondosa TaxID=5627 RepID=A0A1C7M7V9_GRIFR|nr:hypothetical protein A0H81_07206 [Grifola frondosa]
MPARVHLPSSRLSPHLPSIIKPVPASTFRHQDRVRARLPLPAIPARVHLLLSPYTTRLPSSTLCPHAPPARCYARPRTPPVVNTLPVHTSRSQLRRPASTSRHQHYVRARLPLTASPALVHLPSSTLWPCAPPARCHTRPRTPPAHYSAPRGHLPSPALCLRTPPARCYARPRTPPVVNAMSARAFRSPLSPPASTFYRHHTPTRPPPVVNTPPARVHL